MSCGGSGVWGLGSESWGRRAVLDKELKTLDTENQRKVHDAKSREYLARQAALQTEQAFKKRKLEEEIEKKKIQKDFLDFHTNIATWGR